MESRARPRLPHGAVPKGIRPAGALERRARGNLRAATGRRSSCCGELGISPLSKLGPYCSYLFLRFARHGRSRTVDFAQDLVAAAAQNCLADAFAQLDRIVAGLNLANDFRSIRACANGSQAQDASVLLGESADGHLATTAQLIQ